jgi:hypothetical protein
LGQSYPQLSWLIAVYQAEEEIFAPVRDQFWHLLLVLALTAVAVLGLAAWFSMRLAALPVEIEIGPVERPRPTGVEAAQLRVVFAALRASASPDVIARPQTEWRRPGRGVRRRLR